MREHMLPCCLHTKSTLVTSRNAATRVTHCSQLWNNSFTQRNSIRRPCLTIKQPSLSTSAAQASSSFHSSIDVGAATPADAATAAGKGRVAYSQASTAKQKLEMLQQMRGSSSSGAAGTLKPAPPAAAAAAAATTPRRGASAAPGIVDARMYASAVESQRRQAEKLSKANAYIAFLEARLEAFTEHLQAADSLMQQVVGEFGTSCRLAEAASAAVQFGVGREDAVDKMGKLHSRLAATEEALRGRHAAFSSHVPRPVPVTWVGAASEVVLMGEFDGWSRGVGLSAPDVESDGVMRTFEATLQLLPGRYLVKFKVDDEWRAAPEWPCEQDGLGETNNVLVVE